MHTDAALINTYIDAAINEDNTDPHGLLPPGDHSSLACMPAAVQGKARLICKAQGVLAGVELAQMICQRIDAHLQVQVVLPDGSAIQPGMEAFYVTGEVKSILKAERLLLNYMQRMSGIATHTAQFVEAVKGTGATILDTRKTTPNMRYFEKWAVRIGGGRNHRYGLYDMIMLKDNHIDYCGGIAKAIGAVARYQQERGLSLPVEVETRTLQDVAEVLRVKQVQRIMFDNFSPALMQQAVQMVNGEFETEASGGITLATVRSYAETGVNFISVGALTHSSASLDLSLKAMPAA